MEENKIISMMDEDGEKVDFELVEIIELDENRYALLAPIGDEEDAFVYKITTVNDKEEYNAVEDEEEFERVLEEYESTFDE
ncbi:DUF1292 domain-containing protein [Clostridium tagluense]|uniref:DUF1292 domain-containing protein n=1 Tax=Clostridium TaxID=1485 RepID=UPI0013E99604|nr:MULTISPECIES: DUF1292 domain-containing protein [Clostridium]MBU3128130.1 DUF1292 domain-containing protein [Clostridium tagluense]MBW9156622.1 DUF1292 domain-containing protein [Clostridium tagluense]MBZ9624990.1 DUF1292 domain-containing protein [Clostridium sp. FP2]MBZ9636419.1 DUF1292 domain-containing protein [Clostridium sp. FP1]MCB2296971.1 DUF1292 domain-containing protein [Clostridium tagluense]